MLNNFLPFAIGGGANVESQSSYAADGLLPVGNQPGVAVSAFNNKAIRQGTVIASQIAQFVANKTGTDVLDDANMTKLLAQMFGAFDRKTPVTFQYLTSGAATFNLPYKFQVASASATAGATYTDGTTIFTVVTTIATALELTATGAGAPIVSGTLTKTSGTGDTTITFYAVRAPLYLELEMAGAGAGGTGAGTSGASNGTSGGDTTFGTTFLTAHGGQAGAYQGDGGQGGAVVTAAGFNVRQAVQGGQGGGSTENNTAPTQISGAYGGSNPLGGAGLGGANIVGYAAKANTGGGGGGGGTNNVTVNFSGSGGGAGGYMRGVINNPLSTYAISVGAEGTGGTATINGNAGGNGADGMVSVTCHYQ